MPTLEQISELAAEANEQMVREVIALDYAYKTGKLDDWMDRKYQQVMQAAYGDSGSDTGTNPPT